MNKKNLKKEYYNRLYIQYICYSKKNLELEYRDVCFKNKKNMILEMKFYINEYKL